MRRWFEDVANPPPFMGRHIRVLCSLAVDAGVVGLSERVICYALLTMAWSCGHAEERQSMSLTPAFSSPAAVFNYYQDVSRRREWRKCYSCLTPDTQNYILFELYFDCSISGDEKAVEICRSHGLDRESLKLEFDRRSKEITRPGPASVGNNREQDELLLREVVASRVRDKPGFYEAVNTFFQGARPSSQVVAANQTLSQIRIQGDTATGVTQVVVAGLGSSVGEPVKEFQTNMDKIVKFRKIGESWLIDMP